MILLPIVAEVIVCTDNCREDLPDCEVFPVPIMRPSLKRERWQPNSVRAIKGIECEVVDLNSFDMRFLVQDLLDYHIQRDLVDAVLQAKLIDWLHGWKTE